MGDSIVAGHIRFIRVYTVLLSISMGYVLLCLDLQNTYMLCLDMLTFVYVCFCVCCIFIPFIYMRMLQFTSIFL
jgi:hypothetical protein